MEQYHRAAYRQTHGSRGEPATAVAWPEDRVRQRASEFHHATIQPPKSSFPCLDSQQSRDDQMKERYRVRAPDILLQVPARSALGGRSSLGRSQSKLVGLNA